MSVPPAGLSSEAALAQAARAGPYFTIRPWSPEVAWRPLGGLIADPGVLPEQVAVARDALAGRAGLASGLVEERVAASIVFLGLAAQLVSPLLGAAVLAGAVPRLAVTDLWWLPGRGGPWPLAAGPADVSGVGQLGSDRELQEAATLVSAGVHGLTGPFAAAFGSEFRLSPQVLRGNVASALAGASGVLAVAFPARAGTAGQLAEQILAREPLRGTGQLIQPDLAQPRRLFARRSCCLLYRVPGAGVCGDCVLRRLEPLPR